MEFQLHDLLLLLLPGLIAIIVKPHWTPEAKFITALMVCFGAATLETVYSLWATGGCSWAIVIGNLGKSVGLVFTSYATIWKAFRIGDKVEEKINGG